jgi:hypothetical protein
MRGKPFQPGNKMGKGRPPGTRNKRTIFQETLGIHGVEIVNQAKLLALRPNPDIRALRLCFEGFVAKPKPPNSRFPLPRVQTPADLSKALSAVTRAVAAGQLSAQEGLAVAEIIERLRRAFETGEIDQRLRSLEQGGPEIPLEPIVQFPDKQDEDSEIPLEPVVQIPDKKDEEPCAPASTYSRTMRSWDLTVPSSRLTMTRIGQK